MGSIIFTLDVCTRLVSLAIPHLHCLGMVIRVRVPDTDQVSDPTGTCIGTVMIFYSWVAPVPDLNQDGYGMGIFSHP
jgi:hypothetical protein